MRKKSGFIPIAIGIEQAIVLVPEFEIVVRKLEQQVTLRKENELTLFYNEVQQAYKTKWVVHCEPSIASAKQVVRYLGQYTHRVAITNQPFLNIADGKVTFIAKDYRDRAIKKPVTLDGVEFLRRFTMHILPQRFVKIRRFGIYNHTTKRNLELQFVPEEKPYIEKLIKELLSVLELKKSIKSSQSA
jgi:hypothetical protein